MEEQEDISIVSVLLNYIVNALLVGFIIYLLIKIYKSRWEVLVIDSPPPVPKMKRRDFTIAELRAFDGTDNTPILVAVNGKVFDVTNRGKQFYGPGGTYNVFAGRDATRGLATFSLRFDENEQPEYDDLEGLDMEAVKEWEIQFSEKYDLVGKLLKPGEEHTSYSDDEDTSHAEESNAKGDNNTKTEKKVDVKKED